MLKAFACGFLAVSLAYGAAFDGIWTGVLADRNGDLQDLSFRFAQHDSVLTGKMYGDNESVAITDGKADRDRITFLVTTELNGSISKTLFTGTLANGAIQVTRAKVGALDGKGQSFVLKRL